MDSGATETVGSPQALQSVLSAVQKVMLRSKAEIDVEAADGTMICAYSLVWMHTPHGWFSTHVIESTSIPMLLSIKRLRAWQATIDFATNTMAYRCVNCSSESFAIERRLATSPRLVDVSDNFNHIQ